MRAILLLLAAALVVGLVIYGGPATGPAADADTPEAAPEAAPEDPMLAGRATEGDPVLDSPEIDEVEDEVDEPVDITMPPDPVELGDATLEIHLYGNASDDPRGPVAVFDGTVDLWRIDAPANPGWTRGDQLQAQGQIKKGKAVFSNLPLGMYRIHVHEQRNGSADPDPFELAHKDAEIAFTVPLPRRFTVYARIYDERGHEITEARQRIGSTTGSNRVIGAPKWVTPRKLTNPDVNDTITIGGGGWGAFHRSGMRRLTHGTSGFVLGAFREDDRKTSRHEHRYIRMTDRSGMDVTISGNIVSEETYVGVSVPLEMIRARLFLPDGSLARAKSPMITAKCKGILESTLKDPQGYDAWPIEVKVTLEGYETLTFTFRLIDGEWSKTLVPKTETGD